MIARVVQSMPCMIDFFVYVYATLQMSHSRSAPWLGTCVLCIDAMLCSFLLMGRAGRLRNNQGHSVKL